MKPRFFRISITLVVIALGFFIIKAVANFRPFEYALDIVIDGLRPVGEGGTREVAYSLWSFRQIDAIALAFLMLGSVVCCSAIISEEKDDL